MREIKFRFWDKTLNKMAYRHLEKYDQGHPDIVIMQYTGLKDKNGGDIYEGDICRIQFNIDDVEEWIYWTLTHEEKQTQSRIFTVESPIFNNQPELNVDPDKIEVIGNIHEHKHLLEGE